MHGEEEIIMSIIMNYTNELMNDNNNEFHNE